MKSTRRVALCLHSLTLDDRLWLLEKFKPEHRDRLEPMLKELNELKAPADSSLLALAGATPTERTDREAWMHTIGTTEPKAILTILSREPTCIVVALLSVHGWSWTQSFLAMVPLHRRQDIREQLKKQQQIQPSFMIDAILESVSARITDMKPRSGPFEKVLEKELSGVLRKRIGRWSESWAR